MPKMPLERAKESVTKSMMLSLVGGFTIATWIMVIGHVFFGVGY